MLLTEEQERERLAKLGLKNLDSQQERLARHFIRVFVSREETVAESFFQKFKATPLPELGPVIPQFQTAILDQEEVAVARSLLSGHLVPMERMTLMGGITTLVVDAFERLRTRIQDAQEAAEDENENAQASSGPGSAHGYEPLPPVPTDEPQTI